MIRVMTRVLPEVNIVAVGAECFITSLCHGIFLMPADMFGLIDVDWRADTSFWKMKLEQQVS